MLNILKKIIKNSAIFGLGTISTKLAGFILLPIYVSYITVEDYGILAITEITSLILVALISLKIDTAFFRWYCDESFIKKQKSIFFSALIIILIIGVLSFFILYPFSKNLSLLLFSTDKYSYILELMLLSSIFQVFVLIIQYLMRAQEKAILFSVTTLIKVVVTLLLTILFIVKFNRGIEGIYEALITSQLIFFIAIAKYIWDNIEFKIDKNIVYDMLKFSLPLILAEISGILFNVTDRYVLIFLDSMSNVGIYSFGVKISNTIRVFLYTSAMMAITPMIYQYINKPGNKRFYSKLLTYFAFVIMFSVITLSAFSKEIIELFAKKQEYQAAWEVIPFLSLGIFFGIMKDISLTGLNITKKTKIIAVVIFSMAMFNILISLILVKYFSIIGAALSSIVTKMISFIILYKYAQKYYRIPYEISKLIKIIIIGVLILVASAVLTLSNLNILIVLLFKLLLVLLFPVILYFFNFFEPIELERIKETWNNWKNPKNFKKNIRKIKPK
ncbi:MAG: hypothetical protein CR986_01730 [Ignavibacteriae bacterium]|nr:MAG: hypothetical protein CR986_01730 [Ignavibacteriota bacterium]